MLQSVKSVVVGGNQASAASGGVALKLADNDMGIQIIEAGGGFIQQEHRWPFNQRPRDGRPLLLATGEFDRSASRQRFESQFIEEGGHRLHHIGSAQAGEGGRHQ